SSSVFCLHPYYIDVPSLSASLLFDGKCGAGQQSSPTDTHEHRIDIWLLLNYFQAHGSLSGNDLRVIERVDKGCAGFFSVACSYVECLIDSITGPYHGSSLITGRLNFR